VSGKREHARERISRLLNELEPAASALGCELELAVARALVPGNGADRQRYVAGRDGLEGLLAWLVAETEARPG
jgi:gamma-glutamyl:cysteine ligase YbdK (ATP-grasp superfamily)